MFNRRKNFLTHVVLMLVLLGNMVLVTPVFAADITVNTTLDEDGIGAGCSLREAIKAATDDVAYGGCAAGAAGADTITLAADTYTLNDQLLVNSTIIMNGNNATLQADVSPNTATYRIFEVTSAGNLTLNKLTLQNGNCVNALSCTSSEGNPDNNKGRGGAIFNAGSLTLNDSVLSNNAAASGGGGIYHNQGTLNLLTTRFDSNTTNGDGGGINGGGASTIIVMRSTFVGNFALSGGAIATAGGTLNVKFSDISTNIATSSGGGISSGGTLNVSFSSIHDNAADRGGGLFNSGGPNSQVFNSTFYNNSAMSNGGGIFNYEDLMVTNSTFNLNSATNNGGAFYNDPYQHENDSPVRFAVATLKNNILANSSSGGDCFNFVNGNPQLVSGNNNLIETDSAAPNACGTTAPINNSDPQLGTLTGSPDPQWYPLLAGSPATDAGSDSDCAAPPVNNLAQNLDAFRAAITRPQGAHCDIGAVEKEVATKTSSTTTLTSSALNNTSTVGDSVTFKATVTGTGGTPTGDVTFLDSFTPLATLPLNNGVASLSKSDLPPGPHTITTVYNGDSIFGASQSLSIVQKVNKRDTTFDLRTSAAPVALGSPFTFTALLLPASNLQTGNIKFLHEGNTIGIAPLKDIIVNGTTFRGADFITNTFPSGVHSVRAQYDGDSNFNGATSGLVIKTILGQQNTTLELKSSPNPATVGQKITLTARVLPMSDRQTGTVTFFDGATAIFTATLQNGCAGSGLVCREAVYAWLPTVVNAAGQSPNTLTTNPHILSARYNGDPNYKAVTSATPVTQTITNAPVVTVSALNLTVSPGSKVMQLKWNVLNDPTVTSYRILRNAGINDRSQVLEERWPNPAYSDSANLVTGLTYCYQVEARRINDDVAAASPLVCKVFGTLDLYVPNTLGRPGETVRVSVNISNADGLRIASSDIWLDFNSSVIESVGISNTALTQSYTWDSSVQDLTGPPTTTKRLRIAFINTQPAPLKGQGSLFWWFVKVKGQPDQHSPLDLKEFITKVGGSSIQDITNPSQDVPLHLLDGLFTVGTATAGFILGDVDGDGVVRAADALRALSLAVGKPLPSAQELRAGDINSNNRIDAADASMILFFAAHGTFPVPAKKTPVSASDLQAASVVRLSSATAPSGQHVLITLAADNLSQMAGGDFQIAYDPSVVKSVLNVTLTGLAANFKADFQDSGNGLLSIALSNDSEISGSGELLTIELELQSSAPLGASPLTLANANLNDLFGRDFVASFAINTLTRQSGVITVTQGSTNFPIYLPVVSKK